MVDVLQEPLELVDASESEGLSFPPAQHSTNDGSLDTLVEQAHGRGRLDEGRERRHELLDEPRFQRREDRELPELPVSSQTLLFLPPFRFLRTYKLDDLDEHPVVRAPLQQTKQLRRERQVRPGVLARELADQVDRGGHDARIVVAESLAEALDPGVVSAFLAAGPELDDAGPAAVDAPHDEDGLLADLGTRVGEHGEEIWSEVAGEGGGKEEGDGGEGRHEVGDGQGRGGAGEERSRRGKEVLVAGKRWVSSWRAGGVLEGSADLLDEVDDEHGDFCFLVEALGRGEVAYRLDVVLCARHALDNRETGKRDRVAEHLELSAANT